MPFHGRLYLTSCRPIFPSKLRHLPTFVTERATATHTEIWFRKLDMHDRLGCSECRDMVGTTSRGLQQYYTPRSLPLSRSVPTPTNLQILYHRPSPPGMLAIARQQDIHHGILLPAIYKLVACYDDRHRCISTGIVTSVSNIITINGRINSTHMKFGGEFGLLKQIPQRMRTYSMISASAAFNAAVRRGPRRGILGLCAISRILAK